MMIALAVIFYGLLFGAAAGFGAVMAAWVIARRIKGCAIILAWGGTKVDMAGYAACGGELGAEP